MGLMDTAIGFIGSGNMAQALCRGFITSKIVQAKNVMASSPSDTNLATMREMGVATTHNNLEVVSHSYILFVAVKPHIIPAVLAEIGPQVTERHLVISIAAGLTIEYFEECLPRCRFVRSMPNTPSMVKAGATVVSYGTRATKADQDLVKQLFSAVGLCEELAEKHIDACSGVFGSGVGYMFVAIEALADGGVKMGLPRDVAIRLAAQALTGAGTMVTGTGKHPGALKDAVCSPGGSTIAAIHELEKGAFRGTLMTAVEVCTQKATQLGVVKK